MNIYQTEGNHCGCKEKCTCNNKKEGSHKMSHHGYDKCDMDKKNWYGEKEHCPDRVKGFNLCKKRTELRCFKQCQPIAQPCRPRPTDGSTPPTFNYFTSRTNFDFSGLVVVTNSATAATGCTIWVYITDRVSNMPKRVARINPGASATIFTEGLVSLDIACIEDNSQTADVDTTCSGEILFDLEYCATKLCL